MAYKYRCLVLNCKTPRRSLRQLNETRRRIKKFYNYRSQSAAHPFSFKFFFYKFGATAVVSFSMQVVWIYLSQRRGGTETPTQHFTCRSVFILSSFDYKYLSMVNTLAFTWLFLEAQCFLTYLFHV